MSENTNLKHQLTSRHLQMIAMGGAIGTGFFLGSSSALTMAGPSILFGYILGGIIMYALMRALGEMTVDAPATGSFVEFANKYLGNATGFVTGWNSWLLFTFSCMLELTAVSTLLDYWFPGFPHWVSCLVFLLLFGSINLISLKFFGESEFWFALIKIAVILFIIVMGFYLIMFDTGVHSVASDNMKLLTGFDNLFPHGLSGFGFAFIFVVLAFCGTEFISVAAGEAENPRKEIPKAINGTVIKMILLYSLTLVVTILLLPKGDLNTKESVFSTVFKHIGFEHSAGFINFIAITAALSALNSCIYVSSRFMYRLSLSNHAPKMFGKVDKQQLPRNAVYVTVIVAFIAVIANYTMPANILQYLFALITVSILINWFIIILSHMAFRMKQTKMDKKLQYAMPLYPLSSIVVMLVFIGVILSMLSNPNMQLSVYVAPVWVVGLYLIYFINKKIKNK